jgi:SOS-response transcriptional repressor LexA
MLKNLVLGQNQVMYNNSLVVNDDGGARITYSNQPGTFRFVVKTNAWKKEGLYPEDVLVVQEGKKLCNGDWVILEFDGKRIVRLVELMEDVIRFKPLDSTLQPIDWPLHKPIPVVGVVQTIIRNRPKAV